MFKGFKKKAEILSILSVAVFYLAFPDIIKAFFSISWDIHDLINRSGRAVALGKKVFFIANSYNFPNGLLNIYDLGTNNWSSVDYVGDLRIEFATTGVGSKILIGGGNASIPFPIVFSSVDVYDDLTGQWSVANLSAARSQLAATTVQCKAIFAGGLFSPATFSTVDIYDSIQDTWSVSNLSTPRYGLAATSVNGKAYFAGGYNLGTGVISNVVDIYDTTSSSWSTAFLSVGRMDVGATSVGNKVLFAGGETGNGRTNVVDIYDTATNTWSVSHLTSPFPVSAAEGNSVVATTVGNLAFFWVESSEYVDIYDSTTDTWSFELRSSGLRRSAASSGNKAFFPNGTAVEIANVSPSPQEVINETPIVGIEDHNFINNTLSANGTIQDEDSCNWLVQVDYGDGTGVQELTRNGYGFSLDHHYSSPGEYTVIVTVTDDYHNVTTNTFNVEVKDFITELRPAKVWIGLKNSDDVGIKFDLMAEVYKNSTLLTSAQLDSVPGGSSGFNNANLYEIPLTLASPVEFFDGNVLGIKVYARNACVGSGKNSGYARLWFNDSTANTRFGSTIAGQVLEHYLLPGFTLGSVPGSGPKDKLDVQSGAKCSNFKLFGTWTVTP